MPVTRRRRATPPEEPENNNNHASEAAQQEQTAETVEQPEAPEEASAPAPTSSSTPASEEQVQVHEAQAPQASEAQQVEQVEQVEQPQQTEQTQAAETPQPVEATEGTEQPAEAPRQEVSRPAPTHSFAPVTPTSPSVNGDHPEQENVPPSHVERVRRTFRRPSQEQTYPQPAQHAQPSQYPQYQQYQQPPQSPQHQQQQPAAAQAPLQPPTHEISLPLGNLLHLAYNPGYTGAEEARSHLLSQLARESKAGGRARCWNCGSIAVTYERWNTRSRTFGEIGIAFCEICGVWSVM